jgi:molecular chaperone GrpE
MSQDDALPESASIKPGEAEAVATETSQEPIEAAVEPTPIEQLAVQLTEASRKAEENWDKFVRTQAELENLKRRSEKDLQNAHKFALEKFARELLTVVDSLELGLQAATGDNAEVQKLREGMELTLKQLLAVLEKFNVRGIDPVGEKFNPELHQAMAMQPTDAADPNTVVKVFQKGYLLNDRLLRPAMVVIAQAAAGQPNPIGEQA